MIAVGPKKRKLRPDTNDSTTKNNDNNRLKQPQRPRVSQPPQAQRSTSILSSSSSSSSSSNTHASSVLPRRRASNVEATSKPQQGRQPPEPETPVELEQTNAADADDGDVDINQDENDSEDIDIPTATDTTCSQQSSLSIPRNLFHQLRRRSIMGKHFLLGRQRRQQTLIRPPLPMWKLVSSVELNVTASATANGQQPQHGSIASTRGQVEHLAWDAMGMLLATASSSFASSNQTTISIFDWDAVMASHLQATSHSSRSSSKATTTNGSSHDNPGGTTSAPPSVTTTRLIHSVPPMVQFQVPHAVAALQWDPYGPDMLAVAFRSRPYVYIYDVAQVAEAQSNSSTRPNHHHQHRSPSIPRYCYVTVGTHQNQNAKILSGMHFVGRHHVVLAHEGGQLSCWNIPRQNNKNTKNRSAARTAQLVWRHAVSYAITCLSNVSSDCLVVGGQHGTMTFVNWKCRVRAAFSSEPSPKIIARWDTLGSLLSLESFSKKYLNAGWMGIQQIVSLDDDNSSTVEATVSENHKTKDTKTLTPPLALSPPVRLAGCRILWVTQGGWVLEATLRDWSDGQSSGCPVTIHHRPPLVEYQKWDGTAVASLPQPPGNNSNQNATSSSYSTPQSPVQSVINQNKSLLAWTKVPAVTWTLPHHDRLVVTGTSASLQCQRSEDHGICLGWITTESQQQRQQPTTASNSSWRIQELSWPGTTSPPRVFSIHPSGEWMVASKGHSMVLFKAFGKK